MNKHTLLKGCFSYLDEDACFQFILSEGYLKWDGVSNRKNEEFDINRDMSWRRPFTYFDEKFCIFGQYD